VEICVTDADLDEVVMIRNAFNATYDINSTDPNMKYYKKVKVEVSNICRSAIEGTNLFHKCYPNRDRIFANVYVNGTLMGSKTEILKLMAESFVSSVFNNNSEIRNVQLPTADGNFVLQILIFYK